MPVVTGTTQHGIFTVYLLREKHTVTVERQESILTLEELLKVESISNADGRTMITVAPGHPITIFNPRHTGVIFIFRFDHLRVAGFKLNRFVADLPIDTILTESGKYVHLHGLVVTTEHTSETISEWNDGTIENTIG